MSYVVTLREAGTRRWVYTHLVSDLELGWPPVQVRDEREAAEIALRREAKIWNGPELARHPRRPRGAVYVHRVDVLTAEPLTALSRAWRDGEYRR